MPKPAETFSNDYDLATLQECMKKGWQTVAELANVLWRLGDRTPENDECCTSEDLCRYAYQLFLDAIGCRWTHLIANRVSRDCAALGPGDQSENALQTWRALAEAVVRGRSLQAVADFWDAGRTWGKFGPLTESRLADGEWTPHTIPIVELLLRAFDEPSRLYEMYWRVVTDVYLNEHASGLDAIGKKIQSGECFTSEDQKTIFGYTQLATFACKRRVAEDGAVTGGRHYELYKPRGASSIAKALLVAPAYDLGEKWIKSQTWPRHEAICRAPSCGRCFYSGHNNATNCPPASKGDACRKEWTRYKRWLEKQRLDAETKWTDKSLQQQFSEQDEVRTETRDEQISRAHGIGVR